MQSNSNAYKIVNLPGNEQRRFPESMSWDQIHAVMKQQQPQMDDQNQGMPEQKNNPAMINTFLGPMRDPKEYNMLKDKELLSEMINVAAGGPGFKALGKPIAKGMEYFQPQKLVDKFMQNLGGPKTSEENIKEFAKRVYFGRKSAADEALAHKTPVFEALGNKPITSNLETSNYLSKGAAHNNYGGKLKQLHEKYLEEPLLNHSDALQQQMGSRIGQLRKLNKEGKLDRAGQDELSELSESRKHLIKDQEDFMHAQAPEHKQAYDLFRDKWKKNVSIYDESPVLSEIARTGKTQGITPGEITSIFKHPSENVETIAGHMGPSGNANILFNELQSAVPRNAKELAKDIKGAKQFGYQKFMNPEMDLLAKELEKSYTRSERLKKAGKWFGGALGVGAIGIPAGKTLMDYIKKD
jgi:hypothetical protein